VAYPEVEGLQGAEDQGQAIVDSTQRPLQGAFLIPPVLPVVLIPEDITTNIVKITNACHLQSHLALPCTALWALPHF
jgi:hypothetical protein